MKTREFTQVRQTFKKPESLFFPLFLCSCRATFKYKMFLLFCCHVVLLSSVANNWFINDFPHAKRASECLKKHIRCTEKKWETQCVNLVPHFMNNSYLFLSITDCLLLQSMKSEKELLKNPSTSKAWRRDVMWPTTANSCGVCVCVCVDGDSSHCFWLSGAVCGREEGKKTKTAMMF